MIPKILFSLIIFLFVLLLLYCTYTFVWSKGGKLPELGVNVMTKGTFWVAMSAVFTGFLFLSAVVFGYLQWQVLKKQTVINERLVNNQVRALLEVSFDDAREKLIIANIGQLEATDIRKSACIQGGGFNWSFSAAQDDLNPGEEGHIKIPSPAEIAKKAEKGVPIMTLNLEYQSDHANPIKRRFTFFWLDAVQMWRKGQWH